MKTEVGTLGDGAWRITRDDDDRVIGVEIWQDRERPEDYTVLVSRTEIPFRSDGSHGLPTEGVFVVRHLYEDNEENDDE